MIKSVTVTNYINDSIKIELKSPETTGFIVDEGGITGLGPAYAYINTTEFATTDGAVFNSAKASSRNIVMNLLFMESPTIEAVRQRSYKYFPLKRRIKILIEADNRVCETYGYVESNDPSIFSKREGTQISIICPDPYFYSNVDRVILFYGVEPGFEFPFSNESLSTPLIEFGNIKNEPIQSIYYRGDAEVGFTMYIHALGEITNPAIYNITTREQMRLDSSKIEAITGSGIINGDDIIISTISNDKYIHLVRNGVTTNILNCLDKNADWFALSKGDNVFAYTRDYGITNMQFRVEYKEAYEGV